MRILLKIICVLLFTNTFTKGQDIQYAREVIHNLCKPDLHGRGYVNNGDLQAALYLSKQLKKWDVLSFDSTYFQGFTFPVNTFPGTMSFSVNNQLLSPGKDFIVHPESATSHKTYKVVMANTSLLSKTKKWQKCLEKANDEQAIVIDLEGATKEQAELLKALWSNPKPFGAVVFLEEKKLTWSVGRKQNKFPGVTVLKSAWPEKAKTVRFGIDAKFNYEHTAQNVIGYIKGTEQPDSFIVFSAHYDHLGRMGADTYFPGANDNASGTSMILQMAAYYNLRPPKYSVAFMCFAGEEAGLLGSIYYNLNPLFPLDKIRFVINMDIFGTGDEGITVVNAKDNEKEFALLQSINEKNEYVASIKPRGQTQNSDHYPFSYNKVPAFFIYTRGGISAYHDIYDKAETLPLSAYEAIFNLIREFSLAIQ